jgi:hypothetical protein
MQFQYNLNTVENCHMDILPEEVMKGHTAPHMVAIRNSEGLLVLED